MPQITIELSEQELIDLEAAARYMHCGCRAEDTIKKAIRSAITEFRDERMRRVNMDNAEKELETSMLAYVRSDVREYFSHQTPVNLSM